MSENGELPGFGALLYPVTDILLRLQACFTSKTENMCTAFPHGIYACVTQKCALHSLSLGKKHFPALSLTHKAPATEPSNLTQAAPIKLHTQVRAICHCGITSSENPDVYKWGGKEDGK